MEKRNKIKLTRRASQADAAQTPATAPTPTARLPERPLPFDQRYKRITTYLENELSNKIHDLNSARAIPSLAAVLNVALREYLERYHPGN